MSAKQERHMYAQVITETGWEHRPILISDAKDGDSIKVIIGEESQDQTDITRKGIMRVLFEGSGRTEIPCNGGDEFIAAMMGSIRMFDTSNGPVIPLKKVRRGSDLQPVWRGQISLASDMAQIEYAPRTGDVMIRFSGRNPV